MRHPTICAEPGCPDFATFRGRCTRHAPDPNAPRSPNRDMAAHKRMARAVKRRDGGRCRRCGSSKDVQAHHVRALHQGGSDDVDNGVLLCSRCHRDVDPYAR